MIDKNFDETWEDYSDFNQWEKHELSCNQENYAEYMYTRKKTADTAVNEKSSFLGKLGEKMVELIYPPSTYCVVCDSFVDNSRKYNMCDNCIEKVLWIGENTCQICGRPIEKASECICPDCAENEKAFDGGYSCTAYGLYERKLISDFKKSGRAYLARTLGEILYDRIVIEDLKIDGIIPIPVHKDRLKKRGFNQTELMGKYLSKKIGWPLITDAVVRVKNTRAMKQLDRWDRAKNMQGAFAVLKPEKIRNKNLIVLDDIYTTGVTMQECSKILKDEGAEKVYILSFSAGRFVK